MVVIVPLHWHHDPERLSPARSAPARDRVPVLVIDAWLDVDGDPLSCVCGAPLAKGIDERPTPEGMREWGRCTACSLAWWVEPHIGGTLLVQIEAS